MAKDTSLIMEPPTISRFRESSADQAVVKAMADTIEPGLWVSNGLVYADHKAASLDASIYKRAVARALNVPDYKIRTRTWGMKGDKVELNTEAKGAEWQFVVKYDPEREKSQKKAASA